MVAALCGLDVVHHRAQHVGPAARSSRIALCSRSSRVLRGSSTSSTPSASEARIIGSATVPMGGASMSA